MLVTILHRLRDILDGTPLLQPHIKECHDLSGQQQLIPLVCLPEHRQTPGHGISVHLIESDDLTGERSQTPHLLLIHLFSGLQPLSQQEADAPKEVLDRLCPFLL
jgi:hypothetical protein